MTVRQEIGIAASAIGILINVVHFALFFFSATPEKYHDHIWIVGFGFVLTIGGLLLLLDKKQER
jgi:protein-S-isoprenylcysteine O-methyltransferase Ste14